MADMKQTTTAATENEITMEQLMQITKQIATNQLNITNILSELIKCVVAYRHDEIDTIYGLFPQLELIEVMAEDEDDKKELMRQYGNGRRMLKTKYTQLDTEADI